MLFNWCCSARSMYSCCCWCHCCCWRIPFDWQDIPAVVVFVIFVLSLLLPLVLLLFLLLLATLESIAAECFSSFSGIVADNPCLLFLCCCWRAWCSWHLCCSWHHCCIAPMVWSFLSTTVQLHATHRKVEGGERDTQLVHANEANSCLARGYCMSQAEQGEQRLSSPPLSIHALPMAEICDFHGFRPKARTASI